MDTNQAIRLQCLELAVKAGTPWNRLTETADMLTAYVKGVSRPPVSVGLDGPMVQRPIPTDAELGIIDDVIPDKGVAVEEDNRQPLDAIYRANPEALARLRERGSPSIEVNEPDRGVPVEDSPTWPTNMPQEKIERREALMRNGDFGKTVMLGSALRATLPEDQGGEPVEEPPPGVANDPRLPMVTM